MLRIRKLDIFIVKQFGLLFVGTFFISLFVLMMQFVWKYIDTLIGKGLTLDVMAQFFWYMAQMMVPQALPLAILLSSLITFGNLGESSELTAIKAAGISLMQTLRPLIVFVTLIAIGSFYFQNDLGPRANKKMAQLLISMKQKSPELEIPEGIFYDGLPQCNLYVQRKDMETGKLYGIMIYRMTDSYEDAAIILADSGMLQSTAEKKHLLLTLYSGEWFENMRQQGLMNSAEVPYRRETFWKKTLLIDFDGEFNLTDASNFSHVAQGKSLKQIDEDIDSLNHYYDSIGYNYFKEAKLYTLTQPKVARDDSLRIARAEKVPFDTLYARFTDDKKQGAVNMASGKVSQQIMELDFKGMLTSDGDKLIRQHKIEALNKFVLTLSCLFFFFIGAPLGAIIRKGGLGLPIIISVFVFIIFYILDNGLPHGPRRHVDHLVRQEPGHRRARAHRRVLHLQSQQRLGRIQPRRLHRMGDAAAGPAPQAQRHGQGGDYRRPRLPCRQADTGAPHTRMRRLCPHPPADVAAQHHQRVLPLSARP